MPLLAIPSYDDLFDDDLGRPKAGYEPNGLGRCNPSDGEPVSHAPTFP